MFETAKSRHKLFMGLKVGSAAAVVAFALVATYFTNWVRPDVAGVLIGIVTVVIWIVVWATYIVQMIDSYEHDEFKRFTWMAIVGMLVAPILTICVGWSYAGTFGAVMTDIFIVAGWIFTAVMLGFVIFGRPKYILNWVRSGAKDAEVARKQKDRERVARAIKKAASQPQTPPLGSEPQLIPDEPPLPHGEFRQPPRP